MPSKPTQPNATARRAPATGPANVPRAPIPQPPRALIPEAAALAAAAAAALQLPDNIENGGRADEDIESPDSQLSRRHAIQASGQCPTFGIYDPSDVSAVISSDSFFGLKIASFLM